MEGESGLARLSERRAAAVPSQGVMSSERLRLCYPLRPSPSSSSYPRPPPSLLPPLALLPAIHHQPPARPHNSLPGISSLHFAPHL